MILDKFVVINIVYIIIKIIQVLNLVINIIYIIIKVIQVLNFVINIIYIIIKIIQVLNLVITFANLVLKCKPPSIHLLFIDWLHFTRHVFTVAVEAVYVILCLKLPIVDLIVSNFYPFDVLWPPQEVIRNDMLSFPMLVLFSCSRSLLRHSIWWHLQQSVNGDLYRCAAPHCRHDCFLRMVWEHFPQCAHRRHFTTKKWTETTNDIYYSNARYANRDPMPNKQFEIAFMTFRNEELIFLLMRESCSMFSTRTFAQFA